MRVPLEWLKQYVNVQATAQEVGTKLTMGGLEVEGIETSALGPVLDVYITPNRGDCLSLVGVAREVAALYGLPLTMNVPPASDKGGDVAAQTSVTIEDPDLCPRYAARIVRGVKIGPSPAWMQARLEAAGQRAVNNVVDVTNYVMLEMGQPLHAFDLHKLAGGKIIVRRARDGEKIKTLDGEERTLTNSTLVIADSEKPVAVAGVMGGAESEVDENTADILIESAHFDPLSVRRASRVLKLRTEASYRFERVVDPNGVQRAADRACQLLAEMGQKGVVPGIVDVYPQPRQPRYLTLRVSRAASLLGMDITTDSATDCLTRLGFGVTERVDSDTLNVEVPTFRPDITLEEDLIEEVGRIYGYENIPETLPVGATTQGGDSEEGRLIDRIKRVLVGTGLQEVVTHSLTAPAFFDSPDDAARRVPVRNALSAEISGLRRSLVPTLLDVARHNAAYQQTALALFEVGRVWQMQTNETTDAPDHESPNMPNPTEYVAVGGLLVGAFESPGWQTHGKGVATDFYTARGLVEQLASGVGLTGVTFAPLSAEGASALPQFHPGRSASIVLNTGQIIGVVGEIHPRMAETLPFRDRVHVFEISFEAIAEALTQEGPRFHALPRFPSITRDLAPRLPLDVLYQQVEAAITAIQARELPFLASFRLTDVFTDPPVPEGQKSLTLSFTFRASDRTMTDGEVNEALTRLRHTLEAQCSAMFPT
jgi:phenylalanyl-tRNA synthetase beta chain